MAESTLSLKYSTLRAKIGEEVLGFGSDSAQWSTQQSNQIQACLDGGLRWFYHPVPLPGEKHSHEWTFLQLKLDLTMTAPYNTGTVAVSSGVVTLSGGTFPAWAADGVFIINAVAYVVSSRDSGTQITLENTSSDADASSGASYELAREFYTLDDDFGGIDGFLTYRSEENRRVKVPVVSEGRIREQMMGGGGSFTGTPQMAAIRPKASDGTGQRFQLLPWPLADSDYRIEGRAHKYQNTLASDEYPLGGQAHAETILAACRAYAESEYDDKPHGPRYGEFIERLKASVSFDRSANVPEHLGMNRDRSDGPDYDGPEGEFHHGAHGYGASQYVTYDGLLGD